MSDFLDNFKKIIRLCSYSNTYKMAWAKAIVELSSIHKNDEGNLVVFSLEELCEKMIKYYWDQTIYFNLFQSAPNQVPVILQKTKELITLYQKTYDHQPIVYNKIDHILKKEFSKEFNKAIKNGINNIKQNVMPFFLNLEKESFDLYIINKECNTITLQKNDVTSINDNQQDLLDLINYRWTLMLEEYNSSPRIGKKFVSWMNKK